MAAGFGGEFRLSNSAPNLRINPDITLDVVEPDPALRCVVVDDLLLDPGAVVNFARENRGRFRQPSRAYPGLTLPVEDRAAAPLHHLVRAELSRLYPFCRTGIEFQTLLSLTTLAPEDFTWIQRLPHTDPKREPDRANYAAVLYLFDDPELGGTGFYRWRDPEFWAEIGRMQREDADGIEPLLTERFAMFRDPPRYVTESTDAVELIAAAPARFNRLVFYSGDIPHSAWIPHPDRLTDDPATGRLTLNLFASVIPKPDERVTPASPG